MSDGAVRISGILVCHNEEKLVGPCLRSMAPLCDELLVAHDGPCRDRSLEIAREYTRDVTEYPARGAPEVNLIKLLRRAKHDWVVRLDCDETLSPGLLEWLRVFKQRPHEGTTHVSAIWRAIYGPEDESPARAHEAADRVVLFQKHRSRWIGLPHSSMQTDGRREAVRECIYHYAPHQRFTARELITRKLYPFSKKDAALRLRFPIELLGYEGLPMERVLRPVDQWRHTMPLTMGGLLSVRSLVLALGRAVRTSNLRELRANLRWPVPHAAYQLFLGYHLHQLRRAGYRARLARDEVASEPESAATAV